MYTSNIKIEQIGLSYTEHERVARQKGGGYDAFVMQEVREKQYINNHILQLWWSRVTTSAFTTDSQEQESEATVQRHQHIKAFCIKIQGQFGMKILGNQKVAIWKNLTLA